MTALHFGLGAGTDFGAKTKQSESKQRLAAMQIKLSLSTSATASTRCPGAYSAPFAGVHGSGSLESSYQGGIQHFSRAGGLLPKAIAFERAVFVQGFKGSRVQGKTFTFNP